MKPTNVGVVGCGNISSIYLQNAKKVFSNLNIAGVADQVPERAQAQAAAFGVEARTVQDLLADPGIEVILNLTTPPAHFSVCRDALKAGKSVYVEKPLSIELEEGEALVAQAQALGLKIGCAPDTFLGAGIQTCRRLIDDGWIGQPIGGTAFMLCGGHEGWHPDPAFYYQRGGGPLFDMGPYYLTALVALLGPVARVSGLAKTSFPERLITSAPQKGTRIPVEVPTHISGLLDFEAGPAVTIVTSFDVRGGSIHPPIEIYGSEGTLRVPDPNTFGGPIFLRRAGAQDWSEIPLRYPYADNSRGLGLSDLAQALSHGGTARASGDLALHVLEVMHGMVRSSETGRVHAVKNRCLKPHPLS